MSTAWKLDCGDGSNDADRSRSSWSLMTSTSVLVVGLVVLLAFKPTQEAKRVLASDYGLYHTLTEMCCDGNIKTHYAGRSCCGTESIHYLGKACCNNKVVSTFNPLSRPLECCYDLSNSDNIKTFYPKIEICCQGKVLRKPDSYKAYGCCGSQFYDIYTQICCHGLIYPFKFDHACCGQQLVSTIPAPGSSPSTEISSCCGRSYWIDPRKEMCCTVPSSKKNHRGDPQLTNFDTAVYPIGSSNVSLKCCGLEAYDPSNEFCCTVGSRNNLQYYRLPLPAERPSTYQTPTCCGDQLIVDNVVEICCGGRVAKRATPSIRCCNNNVLYDSKSMVCCGTNVIEMIARKSCCPGAGTNYDPVHQRCCGDKITPYDAEFNTLPGIACCTA